MTETYVEPLTAADLGDDASLVVSVSQIVGGATRCHCGEKAVLVVTTEPDHEPGPTCFPHAMEWLDFTHRITADLFGPRETP